MLRPFGYYPIAPNRIRTNKVSKPQIHISIIFLNPFVKTNALAFKDQDTTL